MYSCNEEGRTNAADLEKDLPNSKQGEEKEPEKNNLEKGAKSVDLRIAKVTSIEQYDVKKVNFKENEWGESSGSILMEEGPYLKPMWRIDGHQERLESLSARSVHSDGESSTSRNVVIEAKVINDLILVQAKKGEKYYTRYLCYFVLSGVLFLYGIIIFIMITYFAKSDSPGSVIPTMSPTTWQEGIEESVYNIIIERFPQATTVLSSEASPQYQAIEWLSEKLVNDDSSSWYTEERILQQFALLTLFLSTTTRTPGSSSLWLDDTGWMDSIDECEWQGVTCSNDKTTVVELDLKNNNLVGSLPSEISLLSPSLLSLTISDNSLEGSIPVEVQKLTKLTTLDLSANHLTGSIPRQLGEASGLELLNLSRNALESTLPVEIGMLTQLQYINIGNNELVGSIPSQMGSLRMVEEINLENNELSYALPKEIQFLTSLKKLQLSGNQLLGPLPSEIGSLLRLEVIDLSRNYVFANIPPSFWNNGGLPSLRHLDLSYNLLTGSLPLDFGGSWQQLTSLRLGGRNFLRGSISENPSRYSFLYLPLLEELDLSSNYFAGALPSSLFEVSTLTSLDLSDNEFIGTISPELSHLQELQLLDISGNDALDGTVSAWIGKLSNLKKLSLSGMSGSLPQDLWSLTDLESLRLVNSRLSGALPAGIALLTSLKDLVVADNGLLTGSIPSNIGILPIENLEFSGNPVLEGTIPSELGLLPLTSLIISDNDALQGTIPTELGSLPLTSLMITDNGSLEGAIPSEIGSIEKLSLLHLYNSGLSGSISSYIGQLTSLTSFSVFANRVTGTIPTEIGRLTNLEEFDVGANILTGTIPSQFGKLVNAQIVSLRFNQLAGTIPPEIEKLRSLKALNLWTLTVGGFLPDALCSLVPLPVMVVDCAEVVCKCCDCPEYFPSSTPSLTPYPTVTASPSEERAPPPSHHPTYTSAPSMPISSLTEAMEAAARNNTCFPYTSISAFGNLVTGFDLEGDALVPTPFPFDYNHEGVDSTTLLVGQSGRIKVGFNSTSCFHAIVPSRSFTTEHGDDFSGPIYTAEIGDSFVISWEDVIPLGGSEGKHVVSFQAALHSNGRVEFRWGDGSYPVTHRPLATIANTCTQQYANPSGEPFTVPYGPVIFPEYGVWPGNQCHLFEPDEEVGFYKEINP